MASSQKGGITKYAFVESLKDRKAKTVPNGFIRTVNESKRMPNKLLVDEGKKICNNLMQKWLLDNNILMYSIYNEGKSVVAVRFIRA